MLKISKNCLHHLGPKKGGVFLDVQRATKNSEAP
jgi:hypothetical protein